MTATKDRAVELRQALGASQDREAHRVNRLRLWWQAQWIALRILSVGLIVSGFVQLSPANATAGIFIGLGGILYALTMLASKL